MSDTLQPTPQPLRPGVFAGAVLGLALIALIWQLVADRQSRPEPRLYLSEICAGNATGPADEDGDYSDWIELYNAAAGPVELEGWSLTDNVHQLRKWTFPAGTIPGRSFLIVFASGKNRAASGQTWHTNFRLKEGGEYLGLIRPGSPRVADEFLPKYPKQNPATTFGLGAEFFTSTNGQAPSRAAFEGYLERATPGRTNSARWWDRAADVKFSARRGLYQAPIELELTSKTPGAGIYYTTNGALPTPATGLRYGRPIQVRDTTVIKAVAVRDHYAPSDLTCHTFLFPAGVVRQTGAGWPQAWGVTNGQPIVADYGMDPKITRDPRYRDQMPAALAALPSLCVSLDPQDLFEPTNGIYAHSQESGRDWERRAFVEWIPTGGGPGFHVPGGLRIQGGWNRRPEESPKHSFRLLFKKQYGEAALRYPLFGERKPVNFQTLILRGGNNNSWLHWSGEERHRGEYLRDQWMRETFGAMGQISARGRFAHLYLNGLYWGVYNVSERPDAAFAAAHWGGAEGDYDSMNGEKPLSGDKLAWHELMALLNGGVTNQAVFEAIGQRVNLTNLVDYLMVNFYGGNADWDRSSNWYAARPRRPDGRFHFFVWDAERAIEQVPDDQMAFDDDESPPRFYHRLKHYPEFRRLFAERAQKHLFNDGALSPKVAGARYRQLAAQLDTAILAESARWGDYRREVHRYKTPPYELYTRDDHWRPEIHRLLTEYFPQRGVAVVRMFQHAGLYPPPTSPGGDTH